MIDRMREPDDGLSTDLWHTSNKNLMRNLLVVFLCLLGMNLSAQESGGESKVKKTPEQKAAHRTEEMTKDLGLTTEQVPRVRTINLTYAHALAEVKDMQDKEVRKQRSKELRNKRDADLKAVLTTEQYTKMLALRDQDKGEDKPKGKKPHNE